jgi:hypothetical protein
LPDDTEAENLASWSAPNLPAQQEFMHLQEDAPQDTAIQPPEMPPSANTDASLPGALAKPPAYVPKSEPDLDSTGQKPQIDYSSFFEGFSLGDLPSYDEETS